MVADDPIYRGLINRHPRLIEEQTKGSEMTVLHRQCPDCKLMFACDHASTARKCGSCKFGLIPFGGDASKFDPMHDGGPELHLARIDDLRSAPISRDAVGFKGDLMLEDGEQGLRVRFEPSEALIDLMRDSKALLRSSTLLLWRTPNEVREADADAWYAHRWRDGVAEEIAAERDHELAMSVCVAILRQCYINAICDTIAPDRDGPTVVERMERRVIINAMPCEDGLGEVCIEPPETEDDRRRMRLINERSRAWRT